MNGVAGLCEENACVARMLAEGPSPCAQGRSRKGELPAMAQFSLTTQNGPSHANFYRNLCTKRILLIEKPEKKEHSGNFGSIVSGRGSAGGSPIKGHKEKLGLIAIAIADITKDFWIEWASWAPVGFVLGPEQGMPACCFRDQGNSINSI